MAQKVPPEGSATDECREHCRRAEEKKTVLSEVGFEPTPTYVDQNTL